MVDWLVEVGQTVQRGQALLEIETDKANMEVESAASGKVKQLCAQPGENVEIGQVIAILKVEEAAETTAPPQPENGPRATTEAAESTQSAAVPNVSSGGEVRPNRPASHLSLPETNSGCKSRPWPPKPSRGVWPRLWSASGCSRASSRYRISICRHRPMPNRSVPPETRPRKRSFGTPFSSRPWPGPWAI